jgi:hypothetical protein
VLVAIPCGIFQCVLGTWGIQYSGPGRGEGLEWEGGGVGLERGGGGEGLVGGGGGDYWRTGICHKGGEDGGEDGGVAEY